MNDFNCQIPSHIETRNLRVEVDGQDYKWFGGFGAVLISKERGVKQGTVRVIGGVYFYAYRVFRRWGFNPEVCWTIPCKCITAEWIREFRHRIFSSGAP